jgi:hypothetical protein
MFAAGHETGSDLSGVNRIEEGDTWEAVKQSVSEGGVGGEDDLGRYYSPGAIAGETMRRGGARGVVDPTTPDRLRNMEAGEHTIMFPGSENQIRSVNAAYDPMYTGSNIMGNATVPLLGATAAGTAGLLAVPALMKGEPTSPEERGFESWEEVSRDPTAPLPAPSFGEQMAKAGSTLAYIADRPITGIQGLIRGGYGLLNGEDLATAGAEAAHMMKGGSEEGFNRLGDQVEGLLSPIDKRFPYLKTGKAAGDTFGLLASVFSPF